MSGIGVNGGTTVRHFVPIEKLDSEHIDVGAPSRAPIGTIMGAVGGLIVGWGMASVGYGVRSLGGVGVMAGMTALLAGVGALVDLTASPRRQVTVHGAEGVAELRDRRPDLAARYDHVLGSGSLRGARPVEEIATDLVQRFDADGDGVLSPAERSERVVDAAGIHRFPVAVPADAAVDADQLAGMVRGGPFVAFDMFEDGVANDFLLDGYADG